jgi:hypothetical protein
MYCTLRNQTNTLITKSKEKYYSYQIDECGLHHKDLFSIVRNLLGHKSDPQHDSLDITLDKFSEFFKDKITKIRQNLDSVGNVFHPSPHSVLPIQEGFCKVPLATFQPLTQEQIVKLVKASPTKHCSLDPLPTWLLKDMIDHLSPTITKIVNLSLSTSIFPDDMKQALVTPLLKKTSLDKEILKNYRPVSNLPFLSKLTERAVASQLNDHMTSNDLHVPVQSAYRAQHSTETALLKVLNDLLISVDHGEGVILVLLDLSAAFDTIDHEILINRLAERIGVKDSALSWFKSYLSRRVQSIHVQGKSSEPKYILFGVPQGSVLGPVKFTAYQSPLYDIAMLHGVGVHLYADDTQLYVSYNINSPEELLTARNKLEHCIDDIHAWMTQNKLQLNEDKTELLYVCSSRNSQKIPTTAGLTIGSHHISPSSKAVNLGVVFDQHLKMDSQIKTICKKARFHLRNIGKLRKYLTDESTQKVVHAFVSSHLDCNNALLAGIPKSQIKKLQRIHNTSARVVTRSKKSESASQALKYLHWLPIKQRIEYKILTITYRCLHGTAPKYLCDLLSPVVPSRPLRSSSSLLLHIPRTRTKTYGDRAFSCYAPKLWNVLPKEVRDSNTLEIFKRTLKSHLFKAAFK